MLIRAYLRNETIRLANENLEKEFRIMELQNQCRIIRNIELAAGKEKLQELERKKEEALTLYASLLHRILQEAMTATDHESEDIHKHILEGKIDIPSFVQKYKKLRYTYHK